MKNKREYFESDQKVCILRSAYLGDWMVTIPFISYLIFTCKIKKENIYSIIINDQGINPIPLILGSDSVIAKNSFCIKKSGSLSMLKSILKINRMLPDDVSILYYLPFSNEKRISILKKKCLSYFIHSKKKHGFSKIDNRNLECASQYYSYFGTLGITELPKIQDIYDFLKSERIIGIKEKSTNKVAIYPNSKLEMKIWPNKNFIKVIDYLIRCTDKTIYLIGGKEDYEYNVTILENFRGLVRIENIAGRYNIPETIGFLNDCELLIANDGAPIHMAGIVNTPVIGLYTYKEPLFSWEPISDIYKTYRVNVTCKHCFKASCENPICIREIKVDDVIVGINELLSHDRIRKQEIIIRNINEKLSFKSV